MRTQGEVVAALVGCLSEASGGPVLLDLYERDQGLFYELACVGVSDDAPGWVTELADAASRLRRAVLSGYDIVGAAGGCVVVPRGGASAPVEFPATDAGRLRDFVRVLEGYGSVTKATKNFKGTPVSEAEVRYKLGDPGSLEGTHRRLAARADARPVVLHLDPADVAGLRSQPPYAVHELRRCAAKVTQAPTAVFRGLRNDGALTAGRAYCGRPRWAYDNAGQKIEPPQDSVFVVYVTPDDYVFDWDWVAADPDAPDRPIHWRDRFGEPLPEAGEATIAGAEDVRPGIFDPAIVSFSQRGDCLFFYMEDAPAIAEWINDDLTVFRSFSSNRPVGCKLKNIRAILQQAVTRTPTPRELKVFGPGITITVSWVLFASYQRHLGDASPKASYGTLLDRCILAGDRTLPAMALQP